MLIMGFFKVLAFSWISLVLVIGVYVACDVLGLRTWRRNRNSDPGTASVAALGLFLLPNFLVLLAGLFARVYIPHYWTLSILYALWCQLAALAVLLMLSGVTILAHESGVRRLRFKWVRVLVGAGLFGLLRVGADPLFATSYAALLCGSRPALAAFPVLPRGRDDVECDLCCDYPPYSRDPDACWRLQQQAVCHDLPRDM